MVGGGLGGTDTQIETYGPRPATFDAGGRSPELLRQQYAALDPASQAGYAKQFMGASPTMQKSVLSAMGLGGGGGGVPPDAYALQGRSGRGLEGLAAQLQALMQTYGSGRM